MPSLDAMTFTTPGLPPGAMSIPVCPLFAAPVIGSTLSPNILVIVVGTGSPVAYVMPPSSVVSADPIGHQKAFGFPALV